MKAFFLLIFAVFMLSCAQQSILSQASVDENRAYSLRESDKKKFMTCNFFADETFRGYIYRPPSKKNCFHIDIVESPEELLKNEDLFLQIYPFKILRDELDYGFAQTIYTRSKMDKERVLIKSQLIDTHIIQVELDLSTDYFFLDHVLEICDLDDKWKGLQLVIYERRQGQEGAVPIRITKFLNPPFLIHPEYFRDRAGMDLTAYHPFLDYISKFKSNPESYYELEERMCSHLQH